MTTEFAGAIEIEPPLSTAEIAFVRRLVDGGRPESMPWRASRDGSRLRARGAADIAAALASLRLLVGTMERPGRFHGTVAAYDPAARELVAITAAGGRVTVRTLRKPTSTGRPARVIDLATRRRQVSRVYG